jgi:hypothetical protein
MEGIGPVIAGMSGIVITAMIIRFKLKKKELEMRGSNAELGPVVDALRHDVDDTRAQLADMQERLNFTERLLAGRASQEDRSV